jgi:hypothetical protein
MECLELEQGVGARLHKGWWWLETLHWRAVYTIDTTDYILQALQTLHTTDHIHYGLYIYSRLQTPDYRAKLRRCREITACRAQEFGATALHCTALHCTALHCT